MLALAVLVILSTTTVDAEPADAEMITLTIAETAACSTSSWPHSPADSHHALRWSLWRRKTQARARRSHYARRSTPLPK
jgi:hypothetical protein